MKASIRVLTDHERELREIEDKCLADLAELRKAEGPAFVFTPATVWLRRMLVLVEVRKQALAEMLKLDPQELERLRGLGLAPVRPDVPGGKETLSQFTLTLAVTRAMWRALPELVESPQMPDPAKIAEAIWAKRQARGIARADWKQSVQETRRK